MFAQRRSAVCFRNLSLRRHHSLQWYRNNSADLLLSTTRITGGVTYEIPINFSIDIESGEVVERLTQLKVVPAPGFRPSSRVSNFSRATGVVMATVQQKTIGEALYWAYSNLVMFFASRRHEGQEYQQIDYMIRNKTYGQFLRAEIQIGTLFIDEKQKMVLSDQCSYCGEVGELTVDHLISRKKGGTDDPANLVMACGSCNSSKGGLDFLEWMVKAWDFPDPHMLRRYLKIAIAYCVAHDLMGVSLYRVNTLDPPLPFAIEYLPAVVQELQKYGSEPQPPETEPPPTRLIAWTSEVPREIKGVGRATSVM